MPSAAHLWGLGYTVSRIPQGGFVTFGAKWLRTTSTQTGFHLSLGSRFRVAQSPAYPVGLGRKVGLHHLTPVVAAPA